MSIPMRFAFYSWLRLATVMSRMFYEGYDKKY